MRVPHISKPCFLASFSVQTLAVGYATEGAVCLRASVHGALERMAGAGGGGGGWGGGGGGGGVHSVLTVPHLDPYFLYLRACVCACYEVNECVFC